VYSKIQFLAQLNLDRRLAKIELSNVDYLLQVEDGGPVLNVPASYRESPTGDQPVGPVERCPNVGREVRRCGELFFKIRPMRCRSVECARGVECGTFPAPRGQTAQ